MSKKVKNTKGVITARRQKVTFLPATFCHIGLGTHAAYLPVSQQWSGAMKLWRFECKDERKGPWTSKKRTHDALCRVNGHSPEDGPNPYNDCGINYMHGNICGCRTKAQLRKWFHVPHVQALAKAGFILAEYKVPAKHTYKGAWQSVVPKEKIVHVRDHTAMSLFAKEKLA